jgi:excisionase family DNA binding protein
MKTIYETNQKVMPEPLVYTVEQAAVALNVSSKTIRRFLDRGYLTSSNALRKKIIPRQQVETFLKATCGTPANI